MVSRDFCSDVDTEPLPGTAKTGSTYVLLEWPGAWSRDVLDGDTLGAELSAKLKAKVAEHDATLLLIRHPTRAGRQIEDHHVYLVFAEESVTEVLHVDSPEAVLDLDLSGPGRNGASIRERPLLLVCTHAKRDRCCAVKGRPLVTELAARSPERQDLVWETSHIKGHRFAPTMLLMPWAMSFGRMTPEAAEALLDHAERGLFFVPGNRGRGTLPAPAQVAEVAVAAKLSHEGVQVGVNQLRAGQVEITASTARVLVDDTSTQTTNTVALRKERVDGVVASCGDAPKTESAWVVDAIDAAGAGSEKVAR